MWGIRFPKHMPDNLRDKIVTFADLIDLDGSLFSPSKGQFDVIKEMIEKHDNHAMNNSDLTGKSVLSNGDVAYRVGIMGDELIRIVPTAFTPDSKNMIKRLRDYISFSDQILIVPAGQDMETQRELQEFSKQADAVLKISKVANGVTINHDPFGVRVIANDTPEFDRFVKSNGLLAHKRKNNKVSVDVPADMMNDGQFTAQRYKQVLGWVAKREETERKAHRAARRQYFLKQGVDIDKDHEFVTRDLQSGDIRFSIHSAAKGLLSELRKAGANTRNAMNGVQVIVPFKQSKAVMAIMPIIQQENKLAGIQPSRDRRGRMRPMPDLSERGVNTRLSGFAKNTESSASTLIGSDSLLDISNPLSILNPLSPIYIGRSVETQEAWQNAAQDYCSPSHSDHGSSSGHDYGSSGSDTSSSYSGYDYGSSSSSDSGSSSSSYDSGSSSSYDSGSSSSFSSD